MFNKVLFVDDEENILHSLKRICHQEKIDASFCQSAQEALTLLSNGKFSVIITDMRMPEMDGIEFLKKAQALDSDPVRIVLSGCGDITTAAQAINEGNIFKYLDKPVDKLELIETIHDAIQLYHEKVVKQEKLLKLGQFLSKIVHDIRNPLQGIRGSAEMLSSYCDDDTAREFCEIIIEQSKHLSELSSELINTHASKAVSTYEHDKKPNLLEFIEDWSKMWRNSINGRTVNIAVQEGNAHKVKVPSNDLARILNNLISNSLDIADVSNVQISITDNQDGFLTISFLDNGGGIDDSVLSKIFESFYTFGKEHGTGLGLATVKEIVEKYGGRIKVKNTDWEHGKGAEFLLALPS